MSTRHPARRVLSGLVIVAFALGLAGGRVGARQISAGMLSTMKDLDTWTTYHDDTRQTERGLGVVVSGKGGTMRMSFVAMLEGRFPKTAPRSIRVQASADPLANPNTLRTPTLTLFVDAKAEKPFVLDLGSRMTVDNPAAGAMVLDSVAQITAEEFARVAWAESIRANVFMVDVEFRPDQLKALQKFSDSIFISKKR
ncbi:MAG TPA: hypothetical protein VLT86_03555 [Vicinamibacterales bacterium]|nr:hypothetical protein [Vicinamibacterales bacterium]